VYRTLAQISGRGVNPVGRPRISAPTPITSRRAEWCYAWIEHEWVQINAEDCPTGRQYNKVVSLFSVDTVYLQYVKAFSFTSESASGQFALSRRRFKTIMDYHFAQNRIAVRQKKNVSGKCEGLIGSLSLHFLPSNSVCTSLNLKYNAAVTREDYDAWKMARNGHHQDIADFRRMYHADQLKSRNDPSFVCIGIDGSDQATTYCPQIWTSHLHKDMPSHSYVEQKVIGVVVHGTPDETIFYVADPRVKSGMDLTTNCLLDAVAHHTDLRATSARFQYDGELSF
jgi:hypothetical protein